MFQRYTLVRYTHSIMLYTDDRMHVFVHIYIKYIFFYAQYMVAIPIEVRACVYMLTQTQEPSCIKQKAEIYIYRQAAKFLYEARLFTI